MQSEMDIHPRLMARESREVAVCWSAKNVERDLRKEPYRRLKGLRHAIFVYFQKLNGVFASVEFLE